MRAPDDSSDRRDVVVGIADNIRLDTWVIYNITKDIVRRVAETGDCDVAAELTLVERAVSRLQANLDRWKREGFITPQTDEQIDRALARGKALRRQAARERREREAEAAWAPLRSWPKPQS